MPANTTPIFPLTPMNSAVTVVNADGTTVKTVLTAGSNGARVDAISVCSDDTSDRKFYVYLNDGSTNYLVGTVNVPTLSGTDATTLPVDLISGAVLPWVDASGSLNLKASWKVNVGLTTGSVTAAKTVTFVASFGDY